VEWNQEIWLPTQLPLVSSRIIFSVFDKDQLSNEIVASMRFDLKKYVEMAERGEDFPIFWKNIYGSPLGVSGDHTDKMNENPEYASFWKGRILMQVTAEETDNPRMRLCRVNEEAENESYRHTLYKEYEIMFEVSQGICLPGKEKYKILLKIGDFEIKTGKPSYYTRGYCFWNFRSKEHTMRTFYQSQAEMERIYIYLMDGDDRICYW
jgi:hypothetical protein